MEGVLRKKAFYADIHACLYKWKVDEAYPFDTRRGVCTQRSFVTWVASWHPDSYTVKGKTGDVESEGRIFLASIGRCYRSSKGLKEICRSACHWIEEVCASF
tara:strand:+ start:223 stop:528 length:306 start_codon:yes stop_codon:yes gene_type:complete